MSYVEWRGQTWPATTETAELRLFLWPSDSAHPRALWWLEIFHFPLPPGPDPEALYLCLSLHLSDLFFYENDWRRFSGHAIRADAAWHDRHEHSTRHHNEAESRIDLSAPTNPLPRPEGSPSTDERWTAHQFLLHFGSREGLTFRWNSMPG